MPWSKIENVPDTVKHHKDASLSIAQANWVANIADNAEDADNPWAVAWAQFAKEYKKSEDGKSWVKKEKKKEEASRPIIVAISLARFERAEKLMDLEVCIEFERGDIKVTEEDFDSIIENFESNAVGRDLYIDIAHLTENDKAKSAWDLINLATVKKLYKGESTHPDAEGKKTLIATVEWNETGTERVVEKGEFNYISMTYYDKWEHQVTHEVVGPTATSFAVTNDPYAPFLTKIGDKIAASRSDVVIKLSERAKGGSTMGKKKDKVELSVSTEDLRKNLENALAETIEGDNLPWVQDIQLEEGTTGGIVIFDIQGELKGREFSLAEDDTIELVGDAFEVQRTTDYKRVDEIGTPAPAKEPEEEPQELGRWWKKKKISRKEVEIDNSKGGPDVDDKEKKGLERKAQEAEKQATELARQVKDLKRANSLARRRRMLSYITRPRDGKMLPPVVTGLLENIFLGKSDKDDKPVTLSRKLGDVKKMLQGETEGAAAPAATESTSEVVAAVDELIEEVKAEAEATAEQIVEAEIPEAAKESELEVLRAQIAALIEQIRALGEVPVTQETTQESKKPAEGEGGKGAELSRLANQILEEKKDKRLFDTDGKARFSEREMVRRVQLIAEKQLKGGK